MGAVSKKLLAYQYDLIFNIINNVPIRIFWKDKDGVYLGANKLFLKDAGIDSVDYIIGRNDFEMPWGDTEAKFYRDDDVAVMELNEPKLQYKETQTNDAGEQIILSTSKVPLKDAQGNTVGILGIYEDITYKQYIENKMIEQSKFAQMGEMLNMIAHQWRQPLNAISASAINLSLQNDLGILDGKNIEEISIFIQDQAQKMSSIIDHFMELNKPESNKLFYIKEAVEKVEEIISVQMKNRNIDLEINIDDRLQIFHNEKSVEHVLLNLINNARDAFDDIDMDKKVIKIYTKENDNHIYLFVEDNAGGIDESIISKIFNPYFTTKEQGKGTGIGLYMSKQIIESVDGSSLSVKNNGSAAIFKIKFVKP